MENIFDIDKTYNKDCAPNYTRNYFTIKISSESEYKTIIKVCKALCPMTFGKMPSGAEKRFEYLQFVKYILMKEREFGQRKLSIVKCVQSPSQRFLPEYNDMIGEIREKVSELVRTIVDGPDFAKVESVQPNESRYDDSIHDIQERIDLIAQTLAFAYNYGDDALKIFEDRMRLFHTEMERLAKENYPNVSCKSCWDELYLHLNYARCIYWEKDLLSAYETVNEITHKTLPEDNECFAMLQDENRKYVLENNYTLLLDKKSGEIIEAEDRVDELNMYIPGTITLSFRNIKTGEIIREYDPETPFDIDSYIDALGRYVESHVQEIAKKTFHVQKVTNAEKDKILSRIEHVCNYLKMENRRYGRNSFVSKAKLISAFQVDLLSQSDIAPPKKGTPTTRTADSLVRENNSLHSTYHEPMSDSEGNVKEKEPLYFQWLCKWTEYQFAWNSTNSYFAQKYLEVSIAALKAMTAVGYQVGMETMQLHTERILFAAMETLILDEDGEQELENCFKVLRYRGRCFKLKNPPNKSLITYGKFFKLFGGEKLVDTIERKFDTEDQKPAFNIIFNEATENSVLLHTPILEIRYDEADNAYEAQEFIIIEPENMDSGAETI